MGAVLSCLQAIARTIGNVVMAIVGGIGSILTAIINGVVSLFGIVVSCLTCGRSGRSWRNRRMGRSHARTTRRIY
ncbi:hypothetical protein ESCO_003247 [Escovopsis weberi]|uniref:Uncharacterized protein n=1 Tax=Escovopsis weberi TaxID=150374 RepID=A0A0M8MVI0_ESCWE|nr:hypothetical protein ESCO_003247 [Escovopsis weberi]